MVQDNNHIGVQMDYKIAQEIMLQLGGKKFKEMTRSKSFHRTDNSIMFKIGMKTLNKSTHVKIVREPPYHYHNVQFFKIRGTKVTTVSEHLNVHCTMLINLFEKETGLIAHW